MIIEESMHKNAPPKSRRNSLARKILAVTLSMALMLSTIGVSAFAGEADVAGSPEATAAESTGQDVQALGGISVLAANNLGMTEKQFGSTITINWIAEPGAARYEVLRAFNYGGVQENFVPIASVTTPGYTDYYVQFPAGSDRSVVTYAVIAYSQFNLPIASDSIEVYSEHDTRAITVNAVANGLDAIDLSWNDLEVDWKAPVTYTIYTSATENGVYTPIGSVDSSTSYTDTGKLAGVDYYYRVIATDTQFGGFAGESDPVLGRIDFPIPSSLNAESQGISSIKIDWDAIAGVSEYVVYRSDTADGTYVEIDRVSSPEFTDTGLVDDTEYFYKVAVSLPVAGEGPMSDYASAITDIAIPGIPMNVTAKALSSSTVQVDWDVVKGATGYYVYRSYTESGSYLLVGTVNTNTFINTGLTANTNYYYKVAAFNVHGTGDLSAAAHVKTPGPPPKCAPCVCAKTLSDTSIKLSWCKIKDATGYNVYRSLTKAGPYVYVGSTTTTYYIDEGLTPSTCYYYKATATNAGGEGPMSKCPACAKTKAKLPDAPQTIGATALSSKSVQVNWSAVQGATGYYIYRATSYDGKYINVGRTRDTSFVNNSLTSNTTYYYKVAAYNAVGIGSMSAFDYTTTFIAAPAAPRSLNAKALSSSSVSLTWAAAANVNGYYIYRATSAGGPYQQIDSTTTNSFTDTGLAPYTYYYYKVAAYNDGGPGLQSGYDRVRTLRY